MMMCSLCMLVCATGLVYARTFPADVQHNDYKRRSAPMPPPMSEDVNSDHHRNDITAEWNSKQVNTRHSPTYADRHFKQPEQTTRRHSGAASSGASGKHHLISLPSSSGSSSSIRSTVATSAIPAIAINANKLATPMRRKAMPSSATTLHGKSVNIASATKGRHLQYDDDDDANTSNASDNESTTKRIRLECEDDDDDDDDDTYDDDTIDTSTPKIVSQQYYEDASDADATERTPFKCDSGDGVTSENHVDDSVRLKTQKPSRLYGNSHHSPAEESITVHPSSTLSPLSVPSSPLTSATPSWWPPVPTTTTSENTIEVIPLNESTAAKKEPRQSAGSMETGNKIHCSSCIVAERLDDPPPPTPPPSSERAAKRSGVSNELNDGDYADDNGDDASGKLIRTLQPVMHDHDVSFGYEHDVYNSIGRGVGDVRNSDENDEEDESDAEEEPADRNDVNVDFVEDNMSIEVDLQKVPDDYNRDDYQNDDTAVEGSLTDTKWIEYGNTDAVSRSHLRYLNDNERDLANQRVYKNMQRITRCGMPKPRIVHLVGTDPQKKYVPHCTELHQCGNDTGCCDRTGMSCAVFRSEEVVLYFEVTNIVSGSRSIETMQFINHTECRCKFDDDTFDTAIAQQPPSTGLSQWPANCQCVRHFEVFGDIGQPCWCDCNSENAECDSLSQGHKRFQLQDIQCIHDRRCVVPTCKHGSYNPSTGRCPTKEQKFNIAVRRRTRRHHQQQQKQQQHRQVDACGWF